MLEDAARPKSGADIFREGLESEWQELKQTLMRLPPWFRVSQFLLALGSEERLRRLADQARYERKKSKSTCKREYAVVAGPELAEPFSLLWFEVLDPVDRALLEEHAGLNDG